MEDQTNNPVTIPASNNAASYRFVVGAFIVGLIVAIGGYYIYTTFTTTEPTAADSETVAIVNDEEISRSSLTASMEQTEALALQQGLDTSDPTVAAELQTQALEVVTNIVLLRQAATAAGHTVDDEAVTNEVTALEEQFGGEEGLAAQMATVNLSQAELRKDIAEQLLIDAYISEQVDLDSITATEAEIREVYDQLVASGQEIPDFATVSTAIEAQVVGQKQQQAVNDLIDELRANAEIQILI